MMRRFNLLAAAAVLLWLNSARASTYDAVVLADSPEAYWKLGEAANTDPVADSSGNGHTGTYRAVNVTVGEPALIAGDPATSAAFTINVSPQDYVIVPDSAALRFSTAATMELWFNRATSSNAHGLVAKDTSYIFAQNNTANCSIVTGGTQHNCFGVTNLVVGNTYHLVCTYDGANINIYLNGSVNKTCPLTGSIDQTTVNVLLGVIGAGGNDGSHYGHVALYPTALSAAQVQAHYCAGVGCNTPTPTATGTLAPTATQTPTPTWTPIPTNTVAAGNCTSLPPGSGGALSGWWTADSLSLTNGASVSSWVDSGGAENLATAIGGAAPTYQTNQLNGRPIVRFGGVSAYQLAVPRTSTNLTFMAVLKANTVGGYRTILGDPSGGRDWHIVDSSGKQGLAKSYTTEIGDSTTGVGTSAYHILLVTYDGTTVTFYLDGAADGTASNAVTFTTTQPAYLGQIWHGGPLQYLAADVAQFVQWDTVLTAAERCEAIACVAAEYGLSTTTTSCPTATPTPTGTLTPSATPTPSYTHTPTQTPLPTFVSNQYFATFRHGDANDLYIFQTRDGTNFTTPAGCTNPIGKFSGLGGVGDSVGVNAVGFLHYNGYYWIFHEIDTLAGICHNVIGIQRSSSICGPYLWVTDVAVGPTGSEAWGPRPFVDDDGSIHIVTNVSNADCVDGSGSNIHPTIVDALDSTLTSWSAPAAVGGMPNAVYDTFMLPPSQSPDGKYTIWYTASGPGGFATAYGWASSTSRASGYTVEQSGDFAGWVANNAAVEGTLPFKWPGLANTWRMYLDAIGWGGGYQWSQSNDNWNTWTAGIYPIHTDAIPEIASGTGDFLHEGLTVNTFTPTPTSASTSTPVPTNTPPGVTFTPTRTFTATPTKTPTPTFTATVATSNKRVSAPFSAASWWPDGSICTNPKSGAPNSNRDGFMHCAVGGTFTASLWTGAGYPGGPLQFDLAIVDTAGTPAGSYAVQFACACVNNGDVVRGDGYGTAQTATITLTGAARYAQKWASTPPVTCAGACGPDSDIQVKATVSQADDAGFVFIRGVRWRYTTGVTD